MPRPLSSRLAALLPGPCEICRRWSDRPFCDACMARHRVQRARCPRCGLAQADGLDCAGCRASPPPLRHSRVAVDYGFPWDGLIQALKFGGRTELARPLAGILLPQLRAPHTPHTPDRPDAHARAEVDLVVPVPLSAQRLRERGYNQALLLARPLALELGLTLDAALLLRPLDTPHQATLGREARLENLRGAFMVDPAARPRLAGRRVALVDDVVTTGSTAFEAARELLRGGASAVDLWALARTP